MTQGFFVPFTIEGGVWVSADKASDPEAAKAYVDREYHAYELADMGNLETFPGEPRDEGEDRLPPQTQAEADELARWRTSGNSALDNLLREQIVQKIEAENRNG